MEHDRISYGYSVKLNTGNYESADYHASMSTDLREGETPQQAMARAQEFVESVVRERVQALRPANPSKPQQGASKADLINDPAEYVLTAGSIQAKKLKDVDRPALEAAKKFYVQNKGELSSEQSRNLLAIERYFALLDKKA
jgi:hypothetical protein